MGIILQAEDSRALSKWFKLFEGPQAVIPTGIGASLKKSGRNSARTVHKVVTYTRLVWEENCATCCQVRRLKVGHQQQGGRQRITLLEKDVKHSRVSSDIPVSGPSPSLTIPVP